MTERPPARDEPVEPGDEYMLDLDDKRTHGLTVPEHDAEDEGEERNPLAHGHGEEED